MKVLLTAAMVIMCAAAMSTAVPAVASSASCSTTSAGGEKTPATTNTTVTETGTQGYKCTTAWDASIQPQYEAGGTWHYCNECPPGFHPNTPDQFQPANTGFNWPQIHSEFLYSWTPTITADTPPCSVNWRLQVNFFDTTHFVFQSDVSPTLHKTC